MVDRSTNRQTNRCTDDRQAAAQNSRELKSVDIWNRDLEKFQDLGMRFARFPSADMIERSKFRHLEVSADS